MLHTAERLRLFAAWIYYYFTADASAQDGGRGRDRARKVEGKMGGEREGREGGGRCMRAWRERALAAGLSAWQS